jgi:hypothetical protein
MAGRRVTNAGLTFRWVTVSPGTRAPQIEKLELRDSLRRWPLRSPVHEHPVWLQAPDPPPARPLRLPAPRVHRATQGPVRRRDRTTATLARRPASPDRPLRLTRHCPGFASTRGFPERLPRGGSARCARREMTRSCPPTCRLRTPRARVAFTPSPDLSADLPAPRQLSPRHDVSRRRRRSPFPAELRPTLTASRRSRCRGSRARRGLGRGIDRDHLPACEPALSCATEVTSRMSPMTIRNAPGRSPAWPTPTACGLASEARHARVLPPGADAGAPGEADHRPRRHGDRRRGRERGTPMRLRRGCRDEAKDSVEAADSPSQLVQMVGPPWVSALYLHHGCCNPAVWRLAAETPRLTFVLPLGVAVGNGY